MGQAGVEMLLRSFMTRYYQPARGALSKAGVLLCPSLFGA